MTFAPCHSDPWRLIELNSIMLQQLATMLSSDSAVSRGRYVSVRWSWPMRTDEAQHKCPLLEKRGPDSLVCSDTLVYNKHKILNINFTSK